MAKKFFGLAIAHSTNTVGQKILSFETRARIVKSRTEVNLFTSDLGRIYIRHYMRDDEGDGEALAKQIQSITGVVSTASAPVCVSENEICFAISDFVEFIDVEGAIILLLEKKLKRRAKIIRKGYKEEV